MTADEVCKQIAGELAEAARGLSGGILTPEKFRLLVEDLERQHLKRHGFKLESSVSEGGIVRFRLRFGDTGEVCASMTVDPQTGKMVTHFGCEENEEER